MLTEGILHRPRALGLFPFRLGRREATDILLLKRHSIGLCSDNIITTDHIAAMKTLALRDHTLDNATVIGMHFVLILLATHEVVRDQSLSFRVCLLLVPRVLLINCYSILCLSVAIYHVVRGLGTQPVF